MTTSIRCVVMDYDVLLYSLPSLKIFMEIEGKYGKAGARAVIKFEDGSVVEERDLISMDRGGLTTEELQMPVHAIASNAGVQRVVVVGKLLEQDNLDLGYDAAKGEYVDMVKVGIVDQLKVIKTALVDAASVSSLMTTTEAVVVEIPKEEKDVSAGPNMGNGTTWLMFLQDRAYY